LRFHAGDSKSWVRDPLARPDETPGPYIDSPISGHKTKQHTHTPEEKGTATIPQLTKQHTLKDGIARVFESGASRFPYYCTPPECVPDVIGTLAVWRHNSKKQKQKKT